MFKFLHKAEKNLISVIIPVYNDNVALQKTLSSLDSQKSKGFKYEIVVEDDVKESGSYSARNRAITRSKGEFIAFIDAGTLASSTWLMSGYSQLQKYDYVGGVIEVINSDSVKVNDWLFSFEKNREFAVEEFMNDQHFSPTTNLFIKRSIIENIGGFDDRLKSSGDYEFGNRVYLSGKYKQFFDKELKVIHPARSYQSLIQKQKRLAKGFIDLGDLYPIRFQHLRPNVFKYLTKMILPPVWLFSKHNWLKLTVSEKVKVFGSTYFLSAVQNLYAIQYVYLRG